MLVSAIVASVSHTFSGFLPSVPRRGSSALAIRLLVSGGLWSRTSLGSGIRGRPAKASTLIGPSRTKHHLLEVRLTTHCEKPRIGHFRPPTWRFTGARAQPCAAVKGDQRATPRPLRRTNPEITLDAVVDCLVAALRGRPVDVQSLSTCPWFLELGTRSPRQFPVSYASLLSRCRFPAFEWSVIGFFGNTAALREDDLQVAMFAGRTSGDG